MNEVFHSGEREIQQRVGEEKAAHANGRIITDTIIQGAIHFIEKQPMVIVSSADPQGQVWISALIGDIGFARVPHPKALSIDKSLIRSSAEDIFYRNILKNGEIGSLFIELPTRRRFRVNGVATVMDASIEVAIHEAYPNCPKYIQRRVASLPECLQKVEAKTETGSSLTHSEKEWIQQADTLFVGSRSAEGRLDASHRGGHPGFIEIPENDTLKIPDYRGNSMYNTLGNIVQNPNTGLLFIDFEQGSTLQLTGKAELVLESISETDKEKKADTGRYWLFRLRHWIKTKHHHQVDWEFLDYSPFNPKE